MQRLITLVILLWLIAVFTLPPHLHAAQLRTAQRSISQGRAGSLRLIPNRISLTGAKPSVHRSFDLNLPQGFSISVAVQGLKRVRFMAQSPDGRIFVTDMYNLTDNRKGAVYILDDFDPVTRTFKSVKPYLTGLRNPNSVGFVTDEKGVHWFYLALTDHLLRYKYNRGESSPSGSPEVIATFPDYGLSYKYGGWHLTRTITVGANGKLYVSVGSSCNACEEKEGVRASILEMDPDGKNLRTFARGLRNAVGLRWVKDGLFATNMGSDHLGDHKPADTMYQVQNNTNYGWPYCFQSGPGRFPDVKFNAGGRKMNCRQVPPAYAAFDAHSSPLGLEYFGANYGDGLANTFLVALHGATKKNLKRGYRLVRLGPGRARNDPPEDFINGFLADGKVNGRPVDILGFGAERGFLLTDDYAGVIYYVYQK
ncbi:MAG: glucose/sorbosone dehydrogenase [Pyrinomonadaceae bacterium]